MKNMYTEFHSYVEDDGWEAKEILEAIDFKTCVSRKRAYRQVKRAHNLHRGKYLTLDAARKAESLGRIFLVMEDGQMKGQAMEFRDSFMEEYGLTELEATNIMNGRHIRDYVNKYERMEHMQPVYENSDSCLERIKTREELFAM